MFHKVIASDPVFYLESQPLSRLILDRPVFVVDLPQPFLARQVNANGGFGKFFLKTLRGFRLAPLARANDSVTAGLWSKGAPNCSH